MNAIIEICAFKEWKSTNVISKGALVLWYTLKLIQTTNHLGTEFNAPNKVLKQLAGLSKQGIANARLELEENGLLHYQNGCFGKAGIYHMVSIEDMQRNKLLGKQVDPAKTNSLDPVQPVYPAKTNSLDPAQPVEPAKVNSLDQVKPLALFKVNSLDQVHSLAPSRATGLTVLKEEVEEEEEESPFPLTEQEINPIPIQIYEDNFGIIRPVVKDALLNWSMKLGEDLVIEAINIGVKMGAQTYTYVEKILQEWERANLKTLQDVQIYEIKKDGMKRKRTSILFQQPQQQPNQRHQQHPEPLAMNQSRPYHHPKSMQPSTEENSFFNDLVWEGNQ
ncbi:DnaD domain protein [Bacillaceae bacterium S4-13-58]